MTTHDAVVYHLPHDSTVIPPDLRDSFLLSDAELQAELLAMTDHCTAELYSCTDRESAVIFPVSRLVVDPERFVDDAQEPMSTVGMGVLYTHTSSGERMRNDVTADDRDALLARFYHPHHARLTAAVNAALTSHEYCLVLDCHSFPAVALPYELQPNAPRLDICLGTDPFHTPAWLVTAARDGFEAEGYTVSVDTPYSGALVPLEHYRRDPRVLALMIEVNRGLHVDERTGAKRPDFERHRVAVQRVTRMIEARAAVR